MRGIVAALLGVCVMGSAAACPLLDVQPLPLPAMSGTAEPSVAVHDERFVLTWQARLEEGEAALRFQQFAASGRALAGGEIARGSGWFLNWADFPALLVLDNGDWLAHWLQRSGEGRYSYDIRSVRSRDRGRTWSAPFTLHDDGTQSEHGFVAYAPAGGDAAWIAWLDGRHTAAAQGQGDDAQHGHGGHAGAASGAMSLRVARLGRDGIDQARELDGRVCDCCQVDAARAGDSTLLVYRDRDDDEVRDISLLRHDGTRWQPTQPLFVDGWRIAGCPVNGPAIAAHGAHVAAAAYSEAGGVAAVRLRTSDDSGRHFGMPVTVVQGETFGRLDLAMLADGRTLLARIDGSGTQAILRLSLHAPDGSLLAQADLASLPAGRLVGFPRLAVLRARALVAWTEPVDGRPQVRAARVDIGQAGSACPSRQRS